MSTETNRSFWSTRRRLIAGSVLALTLFGTALAFAEEGDPDSAIYLPDDDLVVFAVPGGDPVDCQGAAPVDDGDGAEDLSTESSEGTTVMETTVEGCFAVSTLGPNGQENHGSVMSALNRALRDLHYHGPRGELISQAAKSDWGKNDSLLDLSQLAGDDSDDESDGGNGNGHGHGVGHAKGKNK